jgi:hypothetical protein
MGWLEVSIKIGLAHPLLMMHVPPCELVASFPDTGNTVYLDPPDGLTPDVHQKNLGVFDLLTLRVRRQCSEEEARNSAFVEFRNLHILGDAARVFWLFFEIVRETEFRKNKTLAGYPVTRTEEIQNNPLVRTCELVSSYDGHSVRTIPLSSHPAIEITESAWNEAARKLSAREEVLPHVSLALDAACFVESDPSRAIIMACAAWETALRCHLRNTVSAPNLRRANLPKLYEFMETAKGGGLFYEQYGKGRDEFLDHQRTCILQLPKFRNELLHEGKAAIPLGTAVDAVLTVLNAIEWLFSSGANP